ncbi:MAG: type II secretion system inner membrane protein GspF [Deltaproteobacteria bacterium]|nr:type II secretion system inner membrane protein GspF [Deltaproteobacteria bacterium]
MPVFQYIGIDSKGKRAAGILDAEHDRAARLKLRRMGVFPTQLGLEGAMKQKMSMGMSVDFGKYFQRVKPQEIAILTRQISSLLAANIPLVDALTALVDQTENVKLRAVLSQVREKVTEGGKLSDALRAHTNIFSELYINMVNAGENSGALEIVMRRLADFTEAQARLRSKVIGAMTYPLIMSIVGVVLMLGLITFVIPKITAIFEDTGAALPLPTKILIGVSNGLIHYWWLVIIVVSGMVWWIRRWLRSPKGRRWWDGRSLKLPIFGNLQRMIIVSRFSRTLATLLSSGVPLLNALDIVRNIMTNSLLREVIEKTRDDVREGQSLADPLKRSGQFPPLVTHMIAIGEKTGELERMLERVAETYDNQVDAQLGALTSLLEPVMILVMAGVVSFIVMSVLLPILKLNQLQG